MRNTTGCSWCSAVNGSRTRWCKGCGHAAWLPRDQCDCRACLGVLFVEEPTKQVGGDVAANLVEDKPVTKPAPKRSRK